MAQGEVVFCVVDSASPELAKLGADFKQVLMPDIVAPTVNLNGTGARQLIEGYTETLWKLREARDALAQITPHGRDYQTVASTFMDVASRQHAHRMKMLNRISMEIEQIALAVQDQDQVRAESRAQQVFPVRPGITGTQRNKGSR